MAPDANRWTRFTTEELEEIGTAVAYYMDSGREIFKRLDREIGAELEDRAETVAAVELAPGDTDA